MTEKESIKRARGLVERVSIESAAAYSRLCGGAAEKTAYTVLNSQLRMASTLAQLEKAISN